ncbi:MAG: hypothetical protein H6822_24950 [Planctomycetaceae bacterium]|nr:hypothetical protein [Planctomycetaceae bacterium]
MGNAIKVVAKAASVVLDFTDDCLTFPYRNSAGDEWEGCLDEWIGNGNPPNDYEQFAVELEGSRYYQIGAAGGGADVVLVRDDAKGTICYLNDMDQSVSEVSPNLDAFIASLRPPA